jgi:hypothetical protein
MATNIDLLTLLPGVEPDANEVKEAELLAYNILSTKFPNLDLREGTALRDLVIRPNATLLAMINKALVFYFSQNSISDVTDDTVPEFVDKMMSNWFLTRKTGEKAVVNARLFFAKSKSITLSPDTFFSTDNTIKYLPLIATSYTTDLLTLDVSTGLYYIDIDLIAEVPGADHNINSGSLVYFSTFDPYFISASIRYLSISASDPETNTQFIARAKNAISTRNLINGPSISSNISQNFTAVTDVYTSGYGSIEMIRDQIQVKVDGITDPVWLHYGGCVDVFCRTPLEVQIVQLVTDANGIATYQGAFYKATQSSLSGGGLPDDIPYSTAYIQTNPNEEIVSITQINTSTGGSYNPLSPTMTLTVANHGLNVGEMVGILLTSTGYTSPSVQALKVVSVTDANTVVTSVPTTWIGGAIMNNTTLFTAMGFTDSVANLHRVDRKNDVGFSPNQVVAFDFGLGNTFKTVSFAFYTFSSINGINSYLTDPANKVAAGDYLARGLNLTKLTVDIAGYVSLPDSAVAATVVTDYLKNLSPGSTFIMADLLSVLYAAGIKTIKTPITITYDKYNRHGFNPESGVITDTHVPGDATHVFELEALTTSVAII